MAQPYERVTLEDGRQGYFYTSPFAGNPIFQPTDEDGLDFGPPELADEEHVVQEGASE